jgi:hypothetical protein
MSGKSSVTVIVLNWNGRELLEDCLGSLEKVDYNNFNVLVVDNGSTDKSVHYIKSTFPNVEVLELNENIGYAAGNNAGFKHIIKNQPDFVIFLNNDTTVASDFVEYLIKPLQKDKAVGQTVPKIYYSNEPQKIWYAGGKVNLWIGNISHSGIRKIDSPNFDILKRTGYATGCCFAMRTVDFDNLGCFDETFPMYAEDVDLSLRIKDSGKSVVFVPDSKIWHKVSASMGGEFSFKKLKRKIMGLFRIYTKHAKVIQWLTTIFCSPFLLLANIIKYFRLYFSE